METESPPSESIDELRQRLNNMKKLMAERQAAQYETDERRRPNSSIIDGSFLSVVFGIALVVILTVHWCSPLRLITAAMWFFSKYACHFQTKGSKTKPDALLRVKTSKR